MQFYLVYKMFIFCVDLIHQNEFLVNKKIVSIYKINEFFIKNF